MWNENEWVRGGGGGGGGWGTFYKTVWQLKGFQKPKSRRNKFRYYCEIHAYTNFHPVEKHKIYFR